jgi:hypothetical protein
MLAPRRPRCTDRTHHASVPATRNARTRGVGGGSSSHSQVISWAFSRRARICARARDAREQRSWRRLVHIIFVHGRRRRRRPASMREHKELARRHDHAPTVLIRPPIGENTSTERHCLGRQAPFGRCWTPAGGVGCQRWELLDPNNDNRTWKGLFWEVEAAAPARVSGGRRRMSSANIRGGYGASGMCHWTQAAWRLVGENCGCRWARQQMSPMRV